MHTIALVYVLRSDRTPMTSWGNIVLGEAITFDAGDVILILLVVLIAPILVTVGFGWAAGFAGYYFRRNQLGSDALLPAGSNKGWSARSKILVVAPLIFWGVGAVISLPGSVLMSITGGSGLPAMIILLVCVLASLAPCFWWGMWCADKETGVR